MSTAVLFKIYSYFTQIGTLFLDLLPHSLRNIIFHLTLKHFGKGSFIDYGTYIRFPFRVSIGDNVWINRNCNFYPSGLIKDAGIIIGNNVAIGPNLSIFCAAHDYRRLDLPDIAKSVRIGDNVWIGGHCIILPGIEIGEGAVVGAGSVVTKNVQPYEIVAGNPARRIKMREIQAQEAS